MNTKKGRASSRSDSFHPGHRDTNREIKEWSKQVNQNYTYNSRAKSARNLAGVSPRRCHGRLNRRWMGEGLQEPSALSGTYPVMILSKQTWTSTCLESSLEMQVDVVGAGGGGASLIQKFSQRAEVIVQRQSACLACRSPGFNSQLWKEMLSREELKDGATGVTRVTTRRTNLVTERTERC